MELAESSAHASASSIFCRSHSLSSSWVVKVGNEIGVTRHRRAAYRYRSLNDRALRFASSREVTGFCLHGLLDVTNRLVL